MCSNNKQSQWWLLAITLLVFWTFFLTSSTQRQIDNMEPKGAYKFWRRRRRKKVPQDESASTFYIYGQNLRYFFAKPLVFIFHLNTPPQWAKKTQKIQFQICVWVVARLPQILKSTFFNSLRTLSHSKKTTKNVDFSLRGK